MQFIKSEQTLKAERRAVNRGLWIAIVAGMVALAVLEIWPQYKHDTLLGLSLVWLSAVELMRPKLKGALWLTPAALVRKIRNEGYRTPVPAQILTFAAIVLLGYSIIAPLL